jgi:hypothetical protein
MTFSATILLIVVNQIHEAVMAYYLDPSATSVCERNLFVYGGEHVS